MVSCSVKETDAFDGLAGETFYATIVQPCDPDTKVYAVYPYSRTTSIDTKGALSDTIIDGGGVRFASWVADRLALLPWSFPVVMRMSTGGEPKTRQGYEETFHPYSALAAGLT